MKHICEIHSRKAGHWCVHFCERLPHLIHATKILFSFSILKSIMLNAHIIACWKFLKMLSWFCVFPESIFLVFLENWATLKRILLGWVSLKKGVLRLFKNHIHAEWVFVLWMNVVHKKPLPPEQQLSFFDIIKTVICLLWNLPSMSHDFGQCNSRLEIDNISATFAAGKEINESLFLNQMSANLHCN